MRWNKRGFKSAHSLLLVSKVTLLLANIPLKCLRKKPAAAPPCANDSHGIQPGLFKTQTKEYFSVELFIVKKYLEPQRM